MKQNFSFAPANASVASDLSALVNLDDLFAGKLRKFAMRSYRHT